MTTKYEFTGDTMEFEGRTLNRIILTSNEFIKHLPIGTLGGWIEGEHNLSHEGTSWVYMEAKVMDDAKVIENADIEDNAIAQDSAVIKGSSMVLHDAILKGQALVFGSSMIGHHAIIQGNAKVSDALVSDKAIVSGNADIHGAELTWLMGRTNISDNAYIRGNKDFISYASNLTVYRTVNGFGVTLNDMVGDVDVIMTTLTTLPDDEKMKYTRIITALVKFLTGMRGQDA